MSKKNKIKAPEVFSFEKSFGKDVLDSREMGLRGLGVKPMKGATSGCKPGYSRHTYIISLDSIEKIKAAALFFGRPETEVVEFLLQYGFKKLEEIHGTECVTTCKRSFL